MVYQPFCVDFVKGYALVLRSSFSCFVNVKSSFNIVFIVLKCTELSKIIEAKFLTWVANSGSSATKLKMSSRLISLILCVDFSMSISLCITGLVLLYKVSGKRVQHINIIVLGKAIISKESTKIEHSSVLQF